MPNWFWSILILAGLLLLFTWPAVLKWWFPPQKEKLFPTTDVERVKEATYSVIYRSLRLEPDMWVERAKGYLTHRQTGVSIKMFDGAHLLTINRRNGETLVPPPHWRNQLWAMANRIMYQREQEGTLDLLDNVLADFERRS